jgi:hypothetical protein
MGRSGFEFMLGPKIRATVFKKEHPTRLFLAWLRARPPTKLIDPGGRSCIYVPITQNGKVVDSQGYVFDLEDE